MDQKGKSRDILQLQIFEGGDLIIKISRGSMQSFKEECIASNPLDIQTVQKNKPELKIRTQELDIPEDIDDNKHEKVPLRWEIRKLFMQHTGLDFEKIVGLLIKSKLYKNFEDRYGADNMEEKLRTCLTQLTYDGELTRVDQSPGTPWIRTKKLEEKFNTQGKRPRNSNSTSFETDGYDNK